MLISFPPLFFLVFGYLVVFGYLPGDGVPSPPKSRLRRFFFCTTDHAAARILLTDAAMFGNNVCCWLQHSLVHSWDVQMVYSREMYF